MSSHTVMKVDVVVLTLCLRKDALWHYAMTNAGVYQMLLGSRVFFMKDMPCCPICVKVRIVLGSILNKHVLYRLNRFFPRLNGV